MTSEPGLQIVRPTRGQTVRRTGRHDPPGQRRADAVALRRGHVRRLRTGLLLDSPAAAEPPDVVDALEHVFGDSWWLTGLAACAVYQARDCPSASSVDVLVPHAMQRRPPAGCRVRRTTRPPADRLWVGGWPVADPERCWCDAADQVSLQDARALITAGLADRILGRSGLRREADERHRAVTRRAAREARLGSESAPECEAAELLAVPGLILHRNCTLLDPSGLWIARPDLHAFGRGLLYEVDSRRHHADDPDFDATWERDGLLAERGYETLHASPRRIRTEASVQRDRWLRTLALRGAAGLGDPPGACRLADGTVVPHS